MTGDDFLALSFHAFHWYLRCFSLCICFSLSHFPSFILCLCIFFVSYLKSSPFLFYPFLSPFRLVFLCSYIFPSTSIPLPFSSPPFPPFPLSTPLSFHSASSKQKNKHSCHVPTAQNNKNNKRTSTKTPVIKTKITTIYTVAINAIRCTKETQPPDISLKNL